MWRNALSGDSILSLQARGAASRAFAYSELRSIAVPACLCSVLTTDERTRSLLLLSSLTAEFMQTSSAHAFRRNNGCVILRLAAKFREKSNDRLNQLGS